MNRPVALVTGAARGIGLATCRELAERGYRLALADLDGALAQSEAKALGEGHVGYALDVTSQAQVSQTVAQIEQAQGPIALLVNNAGIGDQAVSTLEQKAEPFSQLLDVHLRGAFLLSQACARYMLGRGRGAIVNLSSIAAFGGIPGRNAYAAAKAGISGMTRSMACEWARQGVRVNAVAPGYVETDLVRRLAEEGALNQSALEQRTPLGRLAQPQEIAKAILFLASSDASYITGTTLEVDGGWLALGAPEAVLNAD